MNHRSCVSLVFGLCMIGAAAAAAPRIESVGMSEPQPQAGDAATIWYDDFNGRPKAYTESQGEVDRREGFGGAGGAMRCRYEQGKQGEGNRKVFFGDSPVGRVVRKGESFDTVYWRLYVKHQPGWTGAPDKMSRATSLVTEKWNQAMIAHVWSSGESLTLDPASGVRGDRVVTTRYNDFDQLHWLGNKPVSEFKIHATEEAGWWVCVESMARLNTPGKKDGENRLWLDGRPACVRTNLDFRGTFTGKGINAVFLEAYWNKGSPVAQQRWYDNFVISTRPIGPVVCPCRPVLIRAAGAAWEAEIAAGDDANVTVWRSSELLASADRVTADALAPDTLHRCRIRERATGGSWGEWSPWHQAFRTGPP